MTEIDFKIKVSGQGLPFVWGHGLMENMNVDDGTDWLDWKGIAEQVELIRYDARGHGKSESSNRFEDYCWPNLARDMIRIVDKFGTDGFIAGGRSMGCATAVYAAIHEPDRIRGLLLMHPPTAWDTRNNQTEQYEKMARATERIGGKILAKLAGQTPDKIIPPWLLKADNIRIDLFTDAIADMSDVALINALRGAMHSNLPDPEILKSLRVPTLILAWKDDDSHPLETAKILRDLLPQSQLDIACVPGDLERWPGLVRDFLLEIRAR